MHSRPYSNIIEICEQEKEIKWLKQALDESVQVSLSQPQMQSQVETLQSQAKQSQSELAKVLQHAEDLRAMNASLSEKLNESENARRVLQLEVEKALREKKGLLAEIDNERKAAFDAASEQKKLLEQLKLCKEIIDQKDQILRQKETQVVQSEAQLRELTEKNRALEGDRFTHKHRYTSLKEKVSDLETEKASLKQRLESSVSTLETMMGDQLRQSELQLQEVTARLNKSVEENASLEQRLKQQEDRVKQEQQTSLQVTVNGVPLS